MKCWIDAGSGWEKGQLETIHGGLIVIVTTPSTSFNIHSPEILLGPLYGIITGYAHDGGETFRLKSINFTATKPRQP